MSSHFFCISAPQTSQFQISMDFLDNAEFKKKLEQETKKSRVQIRS